MSPLDKVREIEFPKICDPRGNLSFVEGGRHIPFAIKRVYYVYDVPGGETRGGHAHRKSIKVAIAVSGSLTVRLLDGEKEVAFKLNRANKGVLIPPGTWIVLDDFTTGTVLVVLDSEEYDEGDYIRDYEEFTEYAKKMRNE